MLYALACLPAVAADGLVGSGNLIGHLPQPVPTSSEPPQRPSANQSVLQIKTVDEWFANWKAATNAVAIYGNQSLALFTQRNSLSKKMGLAHEAGDKASEDRIHSEIFTLYNQQQNCEKQIAQWRWREQQLRDHRPEFFIKTKNGAQLNWSALAPNLATANTNRLDSRK